jgi:hypothetical protein
MYRKGWRTATSAAIVVAGSLALAGCDGSSSDKASTPRAAASSAVATTGAASSSAPPSDEAADAAAQGTVQNYLDAMKAKDVAKGRAQMCPAGQADFDKAATTPNGDFADTFTVNAVKVDKVERSGDDRKVTATLTATTKSTKQKKSVSVKFTLQSSGGSWCISGEELA